MSHLLTLQVNSWNLSSAFHPHAPPNLIDLFFSALNHLIDLRCIRYSIQSLLSSQRSILYHIIRTFSDPRTWTCEICSKAFVGQKEQKKGWSSRMGYYYTPNEKEDERKIGFSMKGLWKVMERRAFFKDRQFAPKSVVLTKPFDRRQSRDFWKVYCKLSVALYGVLCGLFKLLSRAIKATSIDSELAFQE